ncbi:hypothetical protein BDD43_0393 [Mucilaginibacter gracilis]|uniref:Uncharacterized protein n=2 Tax=Mucilaginibacter gracilis TaxID=423350 RepID=A0A495IU69_9SPHI|nr:hypothetical protein BDD43_0393 [Mucilaginibacter gracilis]
MQLKLNHNYSLGFEPHLTNGVRLIVFNGDDEWVCRKETLQNLTKFIAGPEAHVFKGRLQLYKNDDSIAVEVKGQHIGTIALAQLKGLLQIN